MNKNKEKTFQIHEKSLLRSLGQVPDGLYKIEFYFATRKEMNIKSISQFRLMPVNLEAPKGTATVSTRIDRNIERKDE